MSLRIWLPMTKDLRNQGLDDVAVTNNGATVDNSGKIGKCYYLNGNKISFTNPNVGLWNQFTVCGWVKLADGYTANNGFHIIVFGASYYRICISKDNAAVRTLLSDGTTNHGGSSNMKASELVSSTWYHFAISFDKGVVKIYINGELDNTYTTTITSVKFSNANIDIGSYSTETCKGYINDFRLYDHVLSPLEVKRLSQGLVLHYPLNNNGFGNENLVLNSDTFATGFGASGITPSTTSDGLHQVIAASGNSNWHSSWATSTATSLLENTFAEGDPFTISFTIKSENANSTNPPNIYIKSGMGYYSMQGSVAPNWSTVYYSGTWKDTNSISFHLGFSGRTGTYLFKNWKVEKGLKPTPWCPNKNDDLATTMGMNDGIEYDCSGFGNNGIQNNLPTYFSDTAKYNASIHFDGVNQTIQLPNLATLIPDSIFTFNIWFKRLESEPGSKPWETILGGPNGFELESCSGNNIHDAKIKAYSWGGANFAFEFDKWNMLTMVSNGTNALFYLNGELKLTGTYKALVSGNYFLGSWRDTSTQNYKGYMSDARIYATALSADDILALYNLGGSLDSNGTFHTYEYVEV